MEIAREAGCSKHSPSSIRWNTRRITAEPQLSTTRCAKTKRPPATLKQVSSVPCPKNSQKPLLSRPHSDHRPTATVTLPRTWRSLCRSRVPVPSPALPSTSSQTAEITRKKDKDIPPKTKEYMTGGWGSEGVAAAPEAPEEKARWKREMKDPDFFFAVGFGKSAVRSARSKTALSPSCVKAEHSPNFKKKHIYHEMVQKDSHCKKMDAEK